jgi:hypothetical protein
MVTVHKMPRKIQFQTWIGSRFDKPPKQNKLRPNTTISLTHDCFYVEYGKECCNGITSASAGAKILYFATINRDEEMIPCARAFEFIKSILEIETSKSDNFIMIFTSWQQV